MTKCNPKVLTILEEVYLNKKDVSYEKMDQVTRITGQLSDEITFSGKFHNMQNGFECPPWSQIDFETPDGKMTISTSYGLGLEKGNGTKVEVSGDENVLNSVYQSIKERNDERNKILPIFKKIKEAYFSSDEKYVDSQTIITGELSKNISFVGIKKGRGSFETNDITVKTPNGEFQIQQEESFNFGCESAVKWNGENKAINFVYNTIIGPSTFPSITRNPGR